jgi:spore maturation protein CgeB
MIQADAWVHPGGAPDAECETLPTRSGKPTLRVNGMLLHSKYEPEQEAARLVDSAVLEPGKPVVVIGLGMGYHVAELIKRGFEVFVFEPLQSVAQVALAEGAARAGFLLHVGEPERTDLPALSPNPQFLIHPPTDRLAPGYAQQVQCLLAASTLVGERLNIVIVGPMYGGSLPIAGYLERAFKSLGHNTLLVQNEIGWPLYQEVTRSIESQRASGQLGSMLTHFLSEWTFARVAEFDPEVCIVLAQAPVGDSFPERLRQKGIVTGFWYVENWRHMPYWKDIAAQYDAFFHIQPGEFEQKLDEAGCKHHAFVQTGCDPELHSPVKLTPKEQEEFGCDISFAGAGYYNRLQVFKGLTDFKFKIWGVDWPERDLVPLVQGGERRFDSETFMKIAAGTKVNLNLHSSARHDGIDPDCDAINPRVFELAAAGAFQVCDPCLGLDTHFTEDELPTYRTLAELREKITHYLAHPEERTAVAERARTRALAEHTYAHRAQAMLDFILSRHADRIVKKGVRVQRTVAEVAEQLEAESPLKTWLQTLPPDTLFTQDALNAQVQPDYFERGYPEHLLQYMREVRSFAEGLLKEAR